MRQRLRHAGRRRPAAAGIVQAGPDDVDAVAAAVDALAHHRRNTIRRRAQEVVRALGGGGGDAVPTADAVRALIRAVTPVDSARAWLMLAVLGGRGAVTRYGHGIRRCDADAASRPGLTTSQSDITH